MFDKEPLPRIAESKPVAKYVRTNFNSTPAAAPTTPPPGNEARKEEATTAVDPKTLQEAVNTLSEHVQNLQRALQFSVDKESGDTVVKVVDAETKEIIRQIPSEELLAIANRLRSTAGVLFAESV